MPGGVTARSRRVTPEEKRAAHFSKFYDEVYAVLEDHDMSGQFYHNVTGSQHDKKPRNKFRPGYKKPKSVRKSWIRLCNSVVEDHGEGKDVATCGAHSQETGERCPRVVTRGGQVKFVNDPGCWLIPLCSHHINTKKDDFTYRCDSFEIKLYWAHAELDDDDDDDSELDTMNSMTRGLGRMRL